MIRDRIDTPDGNGALLVRFGAIGLILAAVVVAFAWAAGWLTPSRLTQTKLVDTFEQVNGPHPGFRRNHAKGVCVGGWFDGNGAATRLSKAAVFAPGRVPVVGRFALAGGQPYAADATRTVRSLALQFLLPDGEQWRTGMNNIPVFVVRTPEAFRQQLIASAPDPATGKPVPAKMQAFLAAHPESARAIAAIRNHAVSSGFGNETYNALDAFLLVDASGRKTAVRWSMQPLQPFANGDASGDGNRLFDALIAEVARTPLQWRLVVTVAQPGDATADATEAWPADRERVTVGTLTIDRITGEDGGACRDVNYDPLVLPSGIEASDDPLLAARSAAYSVSFRRRAGEDKPPSAVQVPARAEP